MARYPVYPPTIARLRQRTSLTTAVFDRYARLVRALNRNLGLPLIDAAMAPATLSEENEPLGVADLERSHWTELARKHWPKAVKSKKVQSVVIKTELWNALEMENYHVRSLLILESLRLLEK